MTFDNTPTAVREANRQLMNAQAWLSRKRTEYKRAREDLARAVDWARDYHDKLPTLPADLVEKYAREIGAAAIEYMDAREAYDAATEETTRAREAYKMATQKNPL